MLARLTNELRLLEQDTAARISRCRPKVRPVQVPTWYGWARRRACKKDIIFGCMLTRADKSLMLLNPFNATVYAKVGTAE